MAHTILVVDDVRETRILLRDFLEDRGCKVLEAGDGAEAYAATLQEMPDLVIMDLSMPNVEGVTATSVLRDMSSTAHVPIVIFSGQDEDKVSRMLPLSSKIRFVSKSGDLDRLWGVVSQLLPA
ncbi:MAG: response regulator [Elusimicrobia bacterium]|nr:response regulator [Elusimicrobiota bacterium]